MKERKEQKDKWILRMNEEKMVSEVENKEEWKNFSHKNVYILASMKSILMKPNASYIKKINLPQNCHISTVYCNEFYCCFLYINWIELNWIVLCFVFCESESFDGIMMADFNLGKD